MWLDLVGGVGIAKGKLQSRGAGHETLLVLREKELGRHGIAMRRG